MHAMLAAIRSLPLPLLFTDENGMITQANYRAHILFGQKVSSLAGVHVRLLFSDPACWGRIKTFLRNCGEWQGQAVMLAAGAKEGYTRSLCCATGNGCGGGTGEIISVAFPG